MLTTGKSVLEKPSYLDRKIWINSVDPDQTDTKEQFD